MIEPGNLDIVIYQGATFSKKLKWKSKIVDPITEEITVTAKDLTGYSARMQIREFVDSPDVIISLTTENGRIIITDAVEGEFELFINDVDTASLNFVTGVYDIEFISPDQSYVYRMVSGAVELNKEVTR